MTLDLLVGGMPRGGTTVAAKLLSLHPDTFCYAGESHLVPFMHGMFGKLPCRRDRINSVAEFLRQQFMTSLVEMPRFSVSQGAHPGNLIFSESNVNELVEAVRAHLGAQLFGHELYTASLDSLDDLLSGVDRRSIRGEKTPSNIFAMAEHATHTKSTRNVIVMREPIGVLRSMKARVEGGDAYSRVFKGDIEANIGIYLEYGLAAQRISTSDPEALLVRYEDLAQQPDQVIRTMFSMLGGEPEDRVVRFVEKGGDPEVANRAPMNYRRLHVSNDHANLTSADVWKIYSFTRGIREAFGYSDSAMSAYGFGVPNEWPDIDVPTTLIPLYGFHHPADGGNGTTMKQRAALIIYVSTIKKHDVSVTLKSKFPSLVEDGVFLDISINNSKFDLLKVATGNQTTKIKLSLGADDFLPMGNHAGYAIVELVSSTTYCEIGHSGSGQDAREISFQLNWWSIKKKFGWR